MNTTFLLSMPGGSEWLVIGIAVLLFFGGKKIPEFMRGLGKGIREFKDAKDGVREELESSIEEKTSHKEVKESAKITAAKS